MTRTLPEHGTLFRRKVYHCPCQPCREREREWARTRNRLQAYGRWQPYVDAEPVRAHVHTLMAASIGIQTIARHADVTSGFMTKLLYGERHRGLTPSRRVRPEAAARILAIQPALDLVADGARIDATGTQRRLQALAATGWPQRRIAADAGLGWRVVQAIHRRTLVNAATARAIRGTYDRLWNADPAAHGVPHRYIQQARDTATANGWAPPAAWDDDRLDDPQAHPDVTGQCGTPQGYNAHYRHRLLPVCQPCRTAHNEARRTRPQNRAIKEAAA